MAGEHLVLTGDTRRFGDRVTLSDGTVVDTSPAVLFLDSHEVALEVADLISKGHVAHGHPDDVDVVDGVPVQREFVYDDSNIKALRRGKKG